MKVGYVAAGLARGLQWKVKQADFDGLRLFVPGVVRIANDTAIRDRIAEAYVALPTYGHLDALLLRHGPYPDFDVQVELATTAFREMDSRFQKEVADNHGFHFAEDTWREYVRVCNAHPDLWLPVRTDRFSELDIPRHVNFALRNLRLEREELRQRERDEEWEALGREVATLSAKGLSRRAIAARARLCANLVSHARRRTGSRCSST